MGATAYDKSIRTAGDLRRVAELHPRTEETDELPEAGVLKAVVEAIAEHVAKQLAPLRSEIVWGRIRTRAMRDLLERLVPGFFEEYDQRIRELVDRDFKPLLDQMLLVDYSETYKERHAAWEAEQNEELKQLLGPEVAARLQDAWQAAWKKWREQEAGDDAK